MFKPFRSRVNYNYKRSVVTPPPPSSPPLLPPSTPSEEQRHRESPSRAVFLAIFPSWPIPITRTNATRMQRESDRRASRILAVREFRLIDQTSAIKSATRTSTIVHVQQRCQRESMETDDLSSSSSCIYSNYSSVSLFYLSGSRSSQSCQADSRRDRFDRRAFAAAKGRSKFARLYSRSVVTIFSSIFFLFRFLSPFFFLIFFFFFFLLTAKYHLISSFDFLLLIRFQ